jgi:hypothetical protein
MGLKGGRGCLLLFWEITMKLTSAKAILLRLRRSFRRDGDQFLKEVSGVVHVGANTGQERHI